MPNGDSLSFKRQQWDFFHAVKRAVTGNNRYFFQTLVMFSNKDNQCWKTVATFVDEMGVSEKTVRRSVKELEALNIIFVSRKRKASGKSHPNIYELNFNCPLLDSATQTLTEHKNRRLDAVTMTPTCGQLPKPVPKNGSGFLSSNGHTVHEMRSHSPLDAVTVTDKYKVNINKNINTRGSSSLSPEQEIFFDSSESKSVLVDKQDPSKGSTEDQMSIFDNSDLDIQRCWINVRGMAARKGKKLPVIPSEQDKADIKTVSEELYVDLSIDDNCKLLGAFVDYELDAPSKILNKILNPASRLCRAAEANPQGWNRFIEPWHDFEFNSHPAQVTTENPNSSP